MRELLLYISAGFFLTGILLLFTFAIFVPQITIIMYILSCYFMLSGVATAVMVMLWSHDQSSPEKQQLMRPETVGDAEIL